MKDVMEVVGDWVKGGDPVALATVVDTKKSAPQPPGTKMAVNDSGEDGRGRLGRVRGGAGRSGGRGDPEGRRPPIAQLRDRRRGRVGRRAAVRGRDIDLGRDLRDDGLQGRFRQLGLRGGRGALTTLLEGPRERRREAARPGGRDSRGFTRGPRAGCRCGGDGRSRDLVRAKRALRAGGQRRCSWMSWPRRHG